jgi:hypothetical protein
MASCKLIRYSFTSVVRYTFERFISLRMIRDRLQSIDKLLHACGTRLHTLI